MELTNCLNCNTPLESTQKFCGNCGQKANTNRLTLGHFFHEFFHAFTHTDKGIFHLLFGLLTRPGLVALDYIEGKRKKYFNPFTFFLIMMGIFVLSNRISNPVSQEIHVPAGIMNIPDETAKNKAIAMFIRGGEVRNFTTANGNIISMIAIPMIALIFWLSFKKRKYNYAEHLTANLMFTSFANIFFTLIVFPLQKLTAGTPYSFLFTSLGLILQVGYYTWAYSGLLQVKTFGGGLKVFGVSLLSIFVWSLFSVTMIAIYIYQSWDFYQFFGRMFTSR
jgi:hypothetical protein